MLVEHGVDHVDESFIRGEEAISPGQQVTFQHALHGVLAEHLDDAAVGRQFGAVLVFGEVFRNPEFLGGLVDCLQLVGSGFVGTEHAEVGHVQLHHISQERAQRCDILGLDRSGPVDLDSVVAESRQAQSLLENSAIGVRIGAHPALTRRREFLQFGDQPAICVEQLLGLLRRASTSRGVRCPGFFLTSVSGT